MTREASWRDPRLGEPRELRLPAGVLRYHDAGAGPVPVFAHGYLVNASLWRKLVPLLAKDFRCLTPDLPLGSHVVPMNRDADLSPPGIAGLIAGFLDALDLTGVTLIGNDSGGAYSQLVAAHHPDRLGRLVLATCETPDSTWPPTPGGFGLLKATARTRATYRALYQVLRVPRTWRWRTTYGWLAKHPIDTAAMHSYVRPVLTRREIRFDGRKAIGSVSARYSRAAAERLVRDFRRPTLLAWAEEDHVFPLAPARDYARHLGADLRTIGDSYTYLPEDQPERTAEVLRAWLTRQPEHPSPVSGTVDPMGYRGPLPKNAVARFNTCVGTLRTSPRWGRLVRRHLTQVTYTGRRSGRTFTTPVGYRRTGDVVTIGVRLPDAKSWWRNFTGDGAPLSLELDDTERTGHAVARRDEKGRVTVTVRLAEPA